MAAERITDRCNLTCSGDFSRLLRVMLFLSSALNPPAFSIQADALQDTLKYISPFHIRNERCFRCHGQEWFEISDTSSGKITREEMPEARILDREAFYGSVHRSFKCTDCHSEDFSVYPHPEELKEEIHFNCLDCHGGDSNYAHFGFETIDVEYSKSVHYGLSEKGFTCWQCHDPHGYRLVFRNRTDYSKAIEYDNRICLDCHTGSRFSWFAGREPDNIMKKHSLLEDPELHLSKVSCTECHARTIDTLPVPHLVMEKGKAYRDCNECHARHTALAIMPQNLSRFMITPVVIIMITLYIFAGAFKN